MRSENFGKLTKLDDGIGVVIRLEGGREPSAEFHVVISLVLFSLIVFHTVVFPAFAFQFGVFHAAHAVCVNAVQSRIPTIRDTILIPSFSLIFSTPFKSILDIWKIK
jgi:hypothetical protein